MADFPADLQSFRSSFPLVDTDPNMESMNQFADFNFQSFLPFSSDNFFAHQTPEFPENFPENLLGVFHQANQNAVPASQPPVTAKIEHHESKKRKAVDVSESSSGNYSCPPVSERGSKRKNSSGKGKRVKSNHKEEEKPKEVVHVRARRGQATDSHSLAERVRREKINERLRCLQDIVPGCYKTMGMAMMLDEIINYVQSLQNQVEFLSMKLTAASTFYDFNSESDAVETLQRAKAQEAREMERLRKEGYAGLASMFHSSTWSL